MGRFTTRARRPSVISAVDSNTDMQQRESILRDVSFHVPEKGASLRVPMTARLQETDSMENWSNVLTSVDTPASSHCVKRHERVF